MTQIQLTETQAVILAAACARENADLFPLTTGIKGGAVTKVIGSLMKKGLVERFIGGYPAEGDPEHGMVSFRATRLAFETLGISEDDIPASPSEQPGEAEPDGTGVPEETPAHGDTGAGDAPVGTPRGRRGNPGRRRRHRRRQRARRRGLDRHQGRRRPG
jgi:hypothetical protein